MKKRRVRAPGRWRFFCVLCLLTGMMAAGGGKDAVSLEQPYDIYRTTRSAGIAATETATVHPYFAEQLCVADAADINTEQTDAQVAEGAGVFDLNSRSVVYAKNIYKKLYPASTTKILTAYLTLKYCEDLDVTTTVSRNAADQAADSSVCGLKEGDVLRIRDLFYGMLLRSGNDAAIVIAEHISGSVEAFAELMNREAAMLGATQSHFVNPNGLPDPEHYTSVYDLYLMLAAAVKYETFVDAIHMDAYTASYRDAAGAAVQKTWENTNLYINGQAEAPDGIEIIGGKTGTTNDAGYCLALYSRKASGEELISIVLKADVRANLYLLMNEMLEKAGG